MRNVSEVNRESALVSLPHPAPGAGIVRVPMTLTLLGLFLIAIQAGQPLLGFAVMVSALVGTAAALAWRSVTRRYAPAMALRGQGDLKLADGHYAEARVLYERALDLVQRELPPAAPELLLNYYSLAAVNSMLHEHGPADQYLRKLLRGLNQRVPAPWSGHVAWLMRRVAHHHSIEGRHDQAISLCGRALELVGDAPGADDNTVRSLLDDLAWIHHHAGDYSGAEALFRDALAIHEQYRDLVAEVSQRSSQRRVGGKSPYRVPSPAAATTSGGLERAVAYSLLGLGWTVYERGRYDEARSLFERAKLLAASLGSEIASPPSLAPTAALMVEILRGQGAIEMTLGNYPAAAALYAQAKGYLLFDGPIQTAALCIDLGWLARSCERFAEAETAYGEVSRVLAQHHEGVATIECALNESLAELRRRQGRFREARKAVHRAVALADQCLGSEHPRRAAILAIASRVHTARSEFAEAERCARSCLQILRAGLGPTHPRLADGFVALGEVQLHRGQLGAAEQAFARALELREAVLGPEHPELVEVLEGHVAVLRATMRPHEAAKLVERAHAIRTRSQGLPSTADQVESRENEARAQNGPY